MTDQNVIIRLRDSDTPDALHNLAAQLGTEVTDAAQAVVHVWATGDRTESGKAGSVVLDLEEFAIRPMLSESESSPLNWRLRFMDAAVETELHLRTLLLQKLDGLLGNTAESAASELSAALAAGATPVRVCDEAYVSIRRLVQVDDPKDGFGSEPAFLKLAPAERTKEIQRWKRTRAWAELLSAEPEPERP